MTWVEEKLIANAELEVTKPESKVVELSGVLHLNPNFFAGESKPEPEVVPEPPKTVYHPSKLFNILALAAKVVFVAAVVAFLVTMIAVIF